MKPVIVITRHPDYADEINLHGVDAQVVYMDLGSSFDSTPDDEEQAREWAQDTWSDVRELPIGHPARAEVFETIARTCEHYFDSKQLIELLGV